MKFNFKKAYNKIKHFFKKFDSFQLLTVPVLIILILFSIDFKSYEIKLGVVLPLSGDFALRTQSHLNGIRLAIKHVNKLGGINNNKIKLIIRDSNKHGVAELTRDLIYKDRIEALIGGFTSEETRVMQSLSEKALLPFLTGICTHFETAKSAAYTFRTVTDDQHQFEALSSISNNRFKSKRPAIIYDTELYGSESAQKYKEICSKYTQQITNAVSFPKGQINFKDQLNTLFKGRPDSLIILASAKDSAFIVRQAREMGFKKTIIGASQCASLEFLRLAGIHSESLITTLPFNPRTGGKKSDYFLNEYYEAYGTPADADAATGYECIMIIAMALEELKPDRNIDLREALGALHGWDSIMGSGGFDKYGNQVRPAEIAIIKDKQTIPISMEGLF